MTKHFDDLTNESTYTLHAQLVEYAAKSILAKQGKTMIWDDDLKKVFRFLLYYFNQCPLAEDVFKDEGKEYKLENNIMLCGSVGVGKTFIMDVFSLYLERTQNPLHFRNVSVTKMVNHYKLHNNIDPYTYNEEELRGFQENPVSLCMHDVGLQTHKYYGVDLQVIMDEFFHARYEILTQYGMHTHITTNLPASEIKKVFNDEYGRLEDRFKTYNVINVKGESKR